MKTLRTILTAVDFSPTSAVALAEALRIAAWNRATVRAVHAVDTVLVTDIEAGLTPMVLSIRDGLLTDAKGEWARFAAPIPGADQIRFDAVLDARVRAIIGAAQSCRADLLVLGATGEGKPALGLGTVTSGCVRHAPCDVLIVRESRRGPFRRVIACVDFSETSRGALEAAVRLATQDSAAIDVLHVYHGPWHGKKSAGTPAGDPAFRTAYHAALQARLNAFCEPFRHELTALKAQIEVLDAPNHRAGIPARAAEIGADVVVLGTRGGTNLRDLLLGSTAELLLRELTCSVLAVRGSN